MTLPTVGREELLRKIEAGESFVLVDALSPMAYAHSHLPGAINLPPAWVDARVAKQLPDHSVEIIVYCANADCEDSVECGERLRALGYLNVRHYPGGKSEWRGAGLPLERAGAVLT